MRKEARRGPFFGAGVAIGVGLGFVLGRVALQSRHVGMTSRRRLDLASYVSDQAMLKGRCVEGLWFKGIRHLDMAAVQEVLDSEAWLVQNETKRSGATAGAQPAILLSHRRPKAAEEKKKDAPLKKKKVDPLDDSFVEAECSEVNVVQLDRNRCAVLTQTNSKALPWHVLRYKRSGNKLWKVAPRLETELPSMSVTRSAQKRVASLLAKFVALKRRLAPVLEKIALEKWLPPAGEKVLALSPTTKKRAFAKKRTQSEGLVVVTTLSTSDDVLAAINWACSLQKVRPQLRPLAVFQRLSDVSPFMESIFEVFSHATLSDDDDLVTRDWLPFATIYACHSLGYDVLYQAPFAIWRRDLVADIVHYHEHRLSETLDVLSAASSTHLLTTEVLFIKCNWRSQMLMDWLLYAQDLVATSGFATVLTEHLAEAASLLGLVHERFDPVNTVALIDQQQLANATVVAPESSFTGSADNHLLLDRLPAALPRRCFSADDESLLRACFKKECRSEFS